MENQENTNKKIAYKKAQKRVKDIKNYYYLVLGSTIFGYFLVAKNYNGHLFDISKNATTWVAILWSIFLIGYGIYLFIPYFHNWEEKKIREIMKKNQTNSNNH